MLPLLPAGRYYGNRQRSRTVPGLALIENAYSPSFVIPRHAHASAFFGLVLEGGYRENYENRCRDCNPSTLLFHPSGEVHSENHHDVVVRIFSIELNKELMAYVGEYARTLDGPCEFHAGPLLRLGARLYREFRSDDPVAPLAMEGIALELLAGACRHVPRKARGKPHWLKVVDNVLHDRFRENIALDDIAEAVGVHPSHLARTFRQCHGCTIGDYVRNLRTNQARRELRDSDRPLAEIALDLGYADQSHFATSFKRQTGMAPALSAMLIGRIAGERRMSATRPPRFPPRQSLDTRNSRLLLDCRCERS
jgi:AraC family transcriptional regulator